MLTTGNQLKAARALAGISQAELAKAAEINVTTISAMEGKGAAVLGSGLDTIKAVMDEMPWRLQALNYWAMGNRAFASRRNETSGVCRLVRCRPLRAFLPEAISSLGPIALAFDPVAGRCPVATAASSQWG
jgi:transcriptional regulator with XRE-family HTH domain